MFQFRAVICALLFLCYFSNAQPETTTVLPEEFSESVTTEMAVSQTTTESTTTKSPPTERVTATNLKNSIPTSAPNSKTTSPGRTAEARIPSNVLFSPARAIEALANPADLENVVNDGKTNKEITDDELSNELLDWEPPAYIKDGFPMYLSGFDFDDAPIWVVEMGKMDLHSVVRRGPDAIRDFEKYVARAARTMLNSNSWKNPLGYKGNFILDFDGLKFRHFAQFETMTFLLKLGHSYRKMLEDHTDYVAIINANYPAHALIDLWRPVIGRIMEVVEIYGNDKNKWVPHLLRQFPKESLPEWYGGYANFTPFKVL